MDYEAELIDLKKQSGLCHYKMRRPLFVGCGGMHVHRVPDAVEELTLKRYIARAWPMLDSRAAREMLKRHDVRINGARSGGDALVRGGDRLTLYIDEALLAGTLDIIYQDENLIVADKPANLPVDADGQQIGADTLLSRLRARFPDARLCHRLDTGTGGVVLCAHGERAHAAMLEAFKAHDIQKTYRAIVVGRPERQSARMSGWLIKDAAASRVRVVSRALPGAKKIETGYRLIRATPGGLSELEIDLVTGRTHQIRAHMAYAGHPLLGDDKYGRRDVNRDFHAKNPALWCVRLKITQCALGEKYRAMAFESAPRFPAAWMER